MLPFGFHPILRCSSRSNEDNSEQPIQISTIVLQYLKQLAVRYRSESLLVCCNDKAKVPFVEPGHVLSAGVRGRKSLCPSTSTIVAEGHDMHKKGSLTLSVYLQRPSDCGGQ